MKQDRVAKSSILIVDDIPGNIKILSEILKGSYKVIVATNGQKALEMVASQKIDLILLDIIMPSMDGYELCERLQANKKTAAIPVVFVSAQSEVVDETKGLALGAVDYITKPVSPAILKARVKTQLSLKKLRDSLEEQVALRTEELRASMLESRCSEHAKSEFIARMSHELRTPLNGVIAPLAMLINSENDLVDKKKLNSIYKSATSLLDLVNGILDFSELDREVSIVQEPFLLDDCLHDLREEWLPLASDKGLQFKLQAEQIHAPTACLGDVRRLRNILQQLLDNAVKFTDKGEVSLNVAPAGMFQHKMLFRFVVSDTGIGIDSTKIKSLFQPFTQNEDSGTRSHGGIGLGLAITKRYVERLGGKLEIDSQRGKGSSYYFTLPFAIDGEHQATTASALSVSEVVDQLEKFANIVDSGFLDIDKFLSTNLHKWNTTPWKAELQAIVNMTNQFDDEGALQAIAVLKSKLS